MNTGDNHKVLTHDTLECKTKRFRSKREKDPFKLSYDSRNEPPGAGPPPPQAAYERKYSVFQRLYKLVASPSDAMEDIGSAPDYGGPMFLVILRTILEVVAVSMWIQKFHLVGDSQTVSEAWAFIYQILSIAVVASIFLLVAFWLVKSLLVKYMCDSGSEWSFATAASATGYAYVADVISGIVSLIVTYELMPTLTLNVSNVDAARQAIADFRSQALWIELAVGIPIGLVGMVWKSYLGGLGAKFGTEERCSLAWGFAAFFILALVGWLISFLVRGTV